MPRFWAMTVLLCLPALGAEPDTIDSALKRMYDFNFPASQEILARYIAQHQQDPLPYAFRASAYLFYELDRMHILESEFFIDDNKIADKKKKMEPDPEVRTKFLQAVRDSEARAEVALKADPNDKQALFAMCIAQGVATDYMAFVEKRQIASISVAKKSNGYAQRLMKLDPKFYDAYLTAGISEYMIGSLPFFVKWFVHFDNIEGDKKRGVERLEQVAREGRYFRPFSKILLATIALREKRPRDAQRFLQELAHDYPENPLFRRELDKVSAKIGTAANED
jgi:predicted Zn-dependent protease